MKYTYDAAKQALNVAKHLVWFEVAEEFDWERALVRIDNRKHYSETRFIAMAPIEDRLYTMVFCLRETAVRIISLRKANRREVKKYESQT